MIWVAIFFANAVVLVLEIVGARALTPFFGSSAEAWSGIIGVVLLGLAIGYWYGGVVADKAKSPRERTLLLSGVLSAAGAVIIATWSGGDAFAAFGMLLIPYLGLTLATSVTALFLLFVPSALLAAASPIAIKALIASLDTSATTVGRVSAVSAAGSVIGSLGVGTVLIPYLGSYTAILGAGAVLIVVALLLATSVKSIYIVAACAVAAVLAAIINILFSSGAAAFVVGSLVADIDTRYSRIFVTDSPHELGGDFLRSVRTDPLGVQCASRIIDGAPSRELEFDYTKAFDIAYTFMSTPARILVIGGCNYSYPMHAAVRTSSFVDVVEIDEGMTQIAKEWFGFDQSERVHSIHQDGRFFLNKSEPTERYDVIVVDAFSSPLTTPFQLLTKEAFVAMKDKMTPTGLVVFNIIGSVTGPGDAYVASVKETLKQVFPTVGLYQINTHRSDDIQNIIVVASSHPYDIGAHPTVLPEYSMTLTPISFSVSAPADTLVLTDQFAPIERLTKPMRDSLFSRRPVW